jgi:coenzyme F420-0:L-glutamate ligase/coenzyme F420-1:gamma-L-glutamate ligase
VTRGTIALIPVHGLPELRHGDDLAALVVERQQLEDDDVVVVAQKAVSKVEGRVVRIDDLEPSARAVELAGDERDPRELEAVLRETVRVVRERGPLVIAETRHGFVCASAGVDHSNAPEPGTVVLLPLDPDASARGIRSAIRERTGRVVAVVVSDSFGRPFRHGTTDVAIGVAGLEPLRDLRGTRDRIGIELRTTQVAVADELAAAADLVRGKADGIPVVVVRGFAPRGDGTASELVLERERDLFR